MNWNKIAKMFLQKILTWLEYKELYSCWNSPSKIVERLFQSIASADCGRVQPTQLGSMKQFAVCNLQLFQTKNLATININCETKIQLSYINAYGNSIFLNIKYENKVLLDWSWRV
jgi:adenine-specific DNA methylase